MFFANIAEKMLVFSNWLLYIIPKKKMARFDSDQHMIWSSVFLYKKIATEILCKNIQAVENSDIV